MNCKNCGTRLPSRPTVRFLMTGLLLVLAGLVLLLFLHLAVIVLASVVLVVFGATLMRGALRRRLGRCPSCGHLPRGV
jgi:hypothetical protein